MTSIGCLFITQHGIRTEQNFTTLIEENIAYLKSGFIDFLISQQPEMQGYQGIYTLYRHIALNERVPGKIMMPPDIITEENIDYYLH